MSRSGLLGRFALTLLCALLLPAHTFGFFRNSAAVSLQADAGSGIWFYLQLRPGTAMPLNASRPIASGADAHLSMDFGNIPATQGLIDLGPLLGGLLYTPTTYSNVVRVKNKSTEPLTLQMSMVASSAPSGASKSLTDMLFPLPASQTNAGTTASPPSSVTFALTPQSTESLNFICKTGSVVLNLFKPVTAGTYTGFLSVKAYNAVSLPVQQVLLPVVIVVT
ncbi:hypothetical protein B5M42_014340 [Paenibacillus athensensis]|uniref:Uncharacterized protein n=1 Tax=Paenibacillus athensensis TaxID=1967502 RepID=A0A4Y8Q8P1_9BACL|nr:hypothetical protein [Paenibacillus athensensis]MCD1259993.1 hypothetical protein [Paenibacillus athensensis]